MSDRFSSPAAFRRGAARRSFKFGGIGFMGTVGVILVTFAMLFGACQGIQAVGDGEAQFTIDRMERVVKGDSSKYMVFVDQDKPHTPESTNVYQITDTWLYLRFNSSDLYGRLNEGDTVRCDTWGWRIPFFSKQPNLLSCEIIDKG